MLDASSAHQTITTNKNRQSLFVIFSWSSILLNNWTISQRHAKKKTKFTGYRRVSNKTILNIQLNMYLHFIMGSLLKCNWRIYACVCNWYSFISNTTENTIAIALWLWQWFIIGGDKQPVSINISHKSHENHSINQNSISPAILKFKIRYAYSIPIPTIASFSKLVVFSFSLVWLPLSSVCHYDLYRLFMLNEIR